MVFKSCGARPLPYLICFSTKYYLCNKHLPALLVHHLCMAIIRYQTGQAYIEHTDYFPITPKPDWNWNPARNGSNRFATVFLYLSDVDLGGQTVYVWCTSTAPKRVYLLKRQRTLKLREQSTAPAKRL